MPHTYASRLLIFAICITCCACGNTSEENLPERSISENFKAYWFAGEAEITSYHLEQSRYGETRNGNAVLIYVTEDFNKKSQVKADSKGSNTTAVLKLNFTKDFVTGIYPYSIMQSTFYPLEGTSHALKVSASIQEWCGQVYMQLNNRSDYEITSHSYFEGEGDNNLKLSKTHLENEVWTQLRIDPNLLPVGEITMIPAFEYLRLSHQEIKPYAAIAEFYQDEELAVYKINYPTLKRTLIIYYTPTFPYSIEKWEEINQRDGKEQRTRGIKNSQIKIDYWTKNSVKDLPLHNQLKLN